MKTLCPNLDQEDGLETVLEVPIPEEMFPATKTKWPNIKSWMKSNPGRAPANLIHADRTSQIQLLLAVTGAPLIPLPIPSDHTLNKTVIDHPIESSMAKYIVHQYIAAVGGEEVLNSIESLYAIGKVRMMASELSSGEGLSVSSQKGDNNKAVKVKGMKHGGEVGGFVLWQKRPDLWSLELVLSGTKISAGSDGKVAWRQTPWHNSHASRGPPRPLRRSMQGVDPKLTANLFTHALCIGEKTVNEEDCFVLKLEANSSTLEARSSSNMEIIRHTVWGYFSQRTGLLVQLEDSHLLNIKISKNNNSIFWETTMESSIQDYQTVDGINIAHAGKTCVSLFRYGESIEKNSRTRMEEVWSIEEIGFNIKGLSMDCFLPPSDLKTENEEYTVVMPNSSKAIAEVQNVSTVTNTKLGLTRVAAVDDDHFDNLEDDRGI